MWQKQEYKPWVGNKQVFKNTVPTWSRPMVNGVNYDDEIQKPMNCWYPKARPIKHWRKQLQPRTDTGGGFRRAGVGMPDGVPGGKVTLHKENDDDFDKCCDKENKTIYVTDEYVGKIKKTSNPECCKQANITRQANTKMDKTYYTDSRAYLKARTNTFHQNLSGTKIKGVKYVENEESVWPKQAWASNDNPGTQDRSKLECGDVCCDQEYNLKISRTNGKDTFERTCTNKNRTLVYKPNNSEFFTQGAVDSSTRIDRLRLKTIQKNSNSYGSSKNAARYRGSYTAPYFYKSKLQTNNNNCVHRTGNIAKCFKLFA